MANDYQRNISHTGYLEPERAFLTCSKKGRRHSPNRIRWSSVRRSHRVFMVAFLRLACARRIPL